MKRLMLVLLACAMLLPWVACAASGSGGPLPMTDEGMVQAAVSTLLDYWTDEVYAVPSADFYDGYLEILAIQASYIREDFATRETYARSADALFKDVYCVIDFVLLSDYYGTSPHYFDAGSNNCVVVYRDGTMAVISNSLLNRYRGITFEIDYSHIIEREERYDPGEDNVYHLLGEQP